MALPQPMPGSDWTTETLRQHLLELISVRDQLDRERDVRYQQRYEAQSQALEAARLSAERAVEKAENAAAKRFDSVNEFRAQLADQALTFMPRGESTLQHQASLEKIEALASEHRRDMVAARDMADRLAQSIDDRLKKLEGGAANLQGRLWALGTAIALVVVVVNIAIRFV